MVISATESITRTADRRPALRKRTTPARAADVLIDVLHKAGVRAIFGLPGGAIAPLNDALLDRTDVRVVTTRHEAGAMFAACGYARATEQVAVVMVTSGPGVLNCMTGLASAFCDGLPVLLIAGEVPRNVFGKGALQEGSSYNLNIVGMAKHITKLALEATDPNNAPSFLRRALATAAAGRQGPVLLSLPFDISVAQIIRPGLAGEATVKSSIDEGLVAKVAVTLENAKRPVIFAGAGSRWGHGPERLRHLAERLQIPVMTTPKAKGVFPESHRLSLGVFGFGGHPSAREYLEAGTDVLLAVGTGLGDAATDGWSDLLRPSEHLIQIDTDALRIGRSYPVSVGLVGEAEFVLEQINRKLSPVLHRRTRTFGVRRYTDPSVASPSARISTPRALWELQQVLPVNTRYTCDMGDHLLFAAHYLEINDPQGFLIMIGLASMGSGIAGALGVKLAGPEHSVAAIVGDGCFAMSMGDLATAVHEKVPIVVAVINDGRYGMVERSNANIYGRTPSYDCGQLDVAGVARGLGADVLVIEQPGDLLRADLARSPDRPLVLDIRVDSSIVMPRNKRFVGTTAPGCGKALESVK
ncbi:MAG: thiamine pyrophosphate-binding protein [Deltaproteobacteria bacterium]|nr:thiamine pyrophosphate-binding protein [Deltaproteobacteria bacterium]